VNVWCGVLGNKLIGPFVFDNNLTGNAYGVFLRNELPGLLEDIPLMIRSQMSLQHDGASPHYTGHVRDYLNESFPNRWLGLYRNARPAMLRHRCAFMCHV